jgi:hypothetical protein
VNCDCVDRHQIGCRNVKEKFPKKAPKRLQARSSKRTALAPKRAAFVQQKLKENPWCQAYEVSKSAVFKCGRPSTEVHEPLTRSRAPGEDTILDPNNALALCTLCHGIIHREPALAESLGLLRSSRGLTP